MKKQDFQFALLHLSLIFGGLIFESLLYFFAMAALVGFLPRSARSWLYYLLLNSLAMAIALYLNPPQPGLNQSINGVLGIESLPYWLIVALFTVLVGSLVSYSLNLPLRATASKKREFQR
jgi:hypothetical protein